MIDDAKAPAEVRAAAALALGRIGAYMPKLAPGIARRLALLTVNEGDREDRAVEEAAALGLGLLRFEDPKGVVIAALRDRALGRSNPRTRAFALLALGLIGVQEKDARERVAETFREVIEDDRFLGDDLRACALMGMGLSNDPGHVDDLIPVVANGRTPTSEKFTDLARSYAAAAIGELAVTNRSVATARNANVLARASLNAGPQTVRSAVIALGQLGCQKSIALEYVRGIVETLERVATKGEPHASHLALIALGNLGGAVRKSDLRDRIRDLLLESLDRGRESDRSFGALALGCLGRTTDDLDLRWELKDAVRREFERDSGLTASRGACTIALGLMRDYSAVPGLSAMLADREARVDDRARCVLALGLIRDYRPTKLLRKMFADPLDRALLFEVVTAMGSLGDPELFRPLIDIARDEKGSPQARAMAILALGRFGEHFAIAPLIEILENAKAPHRDRALAAAALGILGGRRGDSPLARIAKDINDHTIVDPIAAVLAIP